jgi:hypothetical protein
MNHLCSWFVPWDLNRINHQFSPQLNRIPQLSEAFDGGELFLAFQLMDSILTLLENISQVPTGKDS